MNEVRTCPQLTQCSLRCSPKDLQSHLLLERLQVHVISVRLQREMLNVINDFPFCNITGSCIKYPKNSKHITSQNCSTPKTSTAKKQSHPTMGGGGEEAGVSFHAVTSSLSLWDLPLSLQAAKRSLLRRRSGRKGWWTHMETDVIQCRI